MNPYDVLGVEPTADTATIRKAYRKRSKKTHPDAGGSVAAQQQLNRAHALLTDPVKRKSFDECGDPDQAENGHREAVANLVAVFLSALQTTDPIKAARQSIRGNLDTFRASIRQCSEKLVRLELTAKRLKYTGDGPDILRQALEHQRAGIERERGNYEAALRTGGEMLALLEPYGYEAPEPGPQVRVGRSNIFEQFINSRME